MSPWRILAKAILLCAAINFAFVAAQPLIMQNQVYNHLAPGRLSFPYAQPQEEQAVHSVSLYDDLAGMFSAHVIAAALRKPAAEFRVVILGNSSTWGAGLPPEGTLSAQINAMHLMTCDQKSVVANNLAFPSTYVMKDLLLLQQAVPYHPDLVLWGVTLKSLENSDVNAQLFLAAHSDPALNLIRQYHLRVPVNSLKPHTVWSETLFGRRADLRNLAILQIDALPWHATGLDYAPYDQAQSAVANDIDPRNNFMDHGAQLGPQDLLTDVLQAGDQLASPAPVLVLNEPIFVADGRNSDRYYDSYYSRPLYDRYRQLLAQWAESSRQPYHDEWNVLPASEFTNSPLHLTAEGELQLAGRLVPTLRSLACKP